MKLSMKPSPAFPKVTASTWPFRSPTSLRLSDRKEGPLIPLLSPSVLHFLFGNFGRRGMGGTGEEKIGFEIALVVSKKDVENGRDEHHGRCCSDCAEFMVLELEKVGLVVERVAGFSDEFLKVGAPMAVLGRAAAELEIRKPTYIGLDLQFEWDEVDAFVRQPDGTLFSWCEPRENSKGATVATGCSTEMESMKSYEDPRHMADAHLEDSVSSRSHERDSDAQPTITAINNQHLIGIDAIIDVVVDPRYCAAVRLSVVRTPAALAAAARLARLQACRSCCLRASVSSLSSTSSATPLPELSSAATSLSLSLSHVNRTGSVVNLDFDGRRIRWDIGQSLVEVLESEGLVKEVFPLHDDWWIFFPAALGLTLQLIDFGSWRSLMLPAFFTLLISWAVMFLQFWKRKNSAMLARWKTSHPAGVGMRCNLVNTEKNYHPSHAELAKKVEEDKLIEKQAYQRDEWLGHLLRFRNDAFFISSIICLQLPFELAYAHLYEIAGSDVIKASDPPSSRIEQFSWIQASDPPSSRIEQFSWIQFGLTAVYLLIIQYLTKIGGKVLQSFVENCIPYLKYSFKKHRTVHNNTHQKGKINGKVQLTSRVEKEHLKPSYSASIGEELEDGLFDDFLELALQFGMIMMFACAFPLAFCFAALNNAAEIRTDALKLLAMMRRPIPRASATIGAWLNIFQFLLVMSICTNCALLVCLYDQERKWRLEPGLAAILVMEHVLLFFKFGFSRFVPEEPAWVRASRLKNAEQAQYLCSRKFLRKASIERDKWREKDE
ncbi:hypothetical protein Syun_026230 [Stephania yunnanensis]|uniref:Anoctamin transmembrane domain-containing protein n=1 Tax=Stephania yunnanensis TaxID=152371 RepID=A0AAP0EVS3_9MAGN